MDINGHIDKFMDYANARLSEAKGDDFPLRLKIEHTLNVLEYVRRIVESERPARDIGRAVLLAALYHDFGRFRQYLRYGTFQDRASCNHGFLGTRELKAEKMLDGETPEIAHLALAAVALHNRYALPKNLPDAVVFTAWAVRDADKLDILRVMDEHLGQTRPSHPTIVLSLPEDPDLHSEKVLACAMAGQPARYTDLLSVNDFRVLLGSWFYDMHFDETRREFTAAGHAKNLIRQLPDNEIYGPVRNKLLASFEVGV